MKTEWYAKPNEEIVAKLEAITGIKSRRYISEKGDSCSLMVAAANAITTPVLINQIDGIYYCTQRRQYAGRWQ